MAALLKIFDFVPGWVYAVVIAALLATVGAKQLALSDARLQVAQTQEALANVKAEHQKLIADAATRTAQAEQVAREKEFTLQTKITALEKKRNEDIAATSRSYERIIAGLRDRPSRQTAPDPAKPGQTRASAGDSKGCSGAELYREDGAFLVGEAARADRLRFALIACYAAWDEAQGILNSTAPPTEHDRTLPATSSGP